jgi:hypothetical protein
VSCLVLPVKSVFRSWAHFSQGVDPIAPQWRV